ncbi:MAG: type IV pilin protein [Fluviibacter sp.]|jgi:type IV pilus assembly protein PilE
MRGNSRRLAGFSLIELLVVMVVVAVLASIAYPAYTSHLKRSHRADARAELLRMQMVVEKQRLTTLGAQPSLPSGWVTAPAVAKHYQLTLQPTGQNYALEARALPGDGQSNDQQGEASCAVLRLVAQGLDTRYEPAACWQ